MNQTILEKHCVSFKMAELMLGLGFIQDCSYAAHLRNNCHKETKFRVLPVVSPGVDCRGYQYPAKHCLDGLAAYNVHELLTMVGAGTNAEGLLKNMIELKTTSRNQMYPLVNILTDPDFIAQCLVDIHATGHLDIKEANARLKKYADESDK